MNANQEKQKAEGSKHKAESLEQKRGQARLPDLELNLLAAETKIESHPRPPKSIQH